MTEIITSFTIYQELWARAMAGSSGSDSSRSFQEEGEDHKLRWCLTKRIKTSRVLLPKSLY
jgi:hypothetical protein